MKLVLISLLLAGSAFAQGGSKIPADSLAQLKLVVTQQELAKTQLQLLQLQFERIAQQEKTLGQELEQLKRKICADAKVEEPCDIDFANGEVKKGNESK